MKRIARFEKVSFRQFSDGWDDTFQAIEKGENKDQSKETLKEIYDRIKLPRRATAGSAGYDFFAPVDIILNPGETIKIPTGIRVWMEPEWVLKCYPRSGLGFKFRLQLNNTVGIIDSDYFYSDNEGHIFAVKGANEQLKKSAENARHKETYPQGKKERNAYTGGIVTDICANNLESALSEVPRSHSSADQTHA